MGTIETGNFADMVLLEANPLDDIRNTQKIAAVIVNGRYLSRAELDKMLAGVESAAGRESTLVPELGLAFAICEPQDPWTSLTSLSYAWPLAEGAH